MLTDTRQALLDAIRDNPDDDAPRLIYADYLDENGDAERAQFIRLQCDEARLPDWHPGRTPLQREHRRLFLKHKKRWQLGLPTWAKGEFKRGFLHKLEMSGAMFRKNMAAIWRIEPVVAVRFKGKVAEFVAALADPLMQQVREVHLSLAHENEVEGVQAMLDAPHLQELRAWDFTLWPETAYPTATLQALERWSLPKLQYLRSFFAAPATDAIVAPIQVALNSSKLWTTITHAVLLSNRTEAAATAFQQAQTKKLTRLWFWTNADDAWLQGLFASKRLGALRSLTIPGCRAAADTWRAFFASPLLGRLTHLSFPSNSWTPLLGEEFAQSPRLKQLRELKLEDAQKLNDGFAQAFATAKAKNLQYLNLQNTHVSENGRQTLRQAFPGCVVD